MGTGLNAVVGAMTGERLDELETLDDLCQLIEGLDLDARERVLDYLIDRYVSQPRREAQPTE